MNFNYRPAEKKFKTTVSMKNKSLTAAIICPWDASVALPRAISYIGLSYTDDDLEADALCHSHPASNPPRRPTKALKASPWAQFESGEITPVERISEGQFNNTVGVDGGASRPRPALPPQRRPSICRREAVRRINRYKNLRGCSARGTAPLDNGKIYLMIEGAELLRDYDGWSDDDRKHSPTCSSTRLQRHSLSRRTARRIQRQS